MGWGSSLVKSVKKIIKPAARIGAAITTGGLSEVAFALAKGLKGPKMPKPGKAEVMPTADDEALARARQRAAARRRGGRASTMLSEGKGLGG